MLPLKHNAHIFLFWGVGVTLFFGLLPAAFAPSFSSISSWPSVRQGQGLSTNDLPTLCVSRGPQFVRAGTKIFCRLFCKLLTSVVLTKCHWWLLLLLLLLLSSSKSRLLLLLLFPFSAGAFCFPATASFRLCLLSCFCCSRFSLANFFFSSRIRFFSSHSVQIHFCGKTPF